MREEFEKLSEIADIIKREKAVFVGDGYRIRGNEQAESYLDGAWYAYQEQQKKIDFLNMKLEATKCVSSKRREEVLCRDSKINAVKKEINDFFDNQAMTPSPREYANKLADVLELLK